ncbi:MAG: endonuclease [Flavobacteriaceae bacterium]
MKNHLSRRQQFISVVAMLMGFVTFAQAPAYYNGTDLTKTGDELKTLLATLITNTQTVNLTYTPGVWEALQQTDLDPTNSNNVFLIYGYNDTDGNLATDRTRSKDLNGGNSGEWNREHTYPRSLGNPNLGSTGPGSDAHHLRASDITANSTRSNFPFADGSGNAGVINGNTWYPGDEWKGDIARMMMYMYLRYGNQCLATVVGTGTQNYHPDMMDIFLEWNSEDPVSQYEINRNVLLEGIQGNRNPFIDNPAFATTIWGGPQAEDRFNGGVTDTQAPTIPANLVASNTTQTETTLTWNASTDNIGVLAYQVFNGATQITSVAETSYTVSGLTASTSYSFTVRAIDAASNASADSNSATVTTLDNVVTPPTGDAIVFQGYEGTAADTWAYTVSPVTCNDGGNDVWDVVSSVGSISAANTDTNFFGVRDLEGNCGTSAGGTIAFNAVDITGHEDVTLSFALNVVGYDVSNGDTISYEIFHDEVSQGVVTITDASPFDTSGWTTITQAVPNTVNSVRMTLAVQQNGGSDYAGFDDVKLAGTAISSTPSVVINEVDADTAGTDTLEFVELYDGGTGNTALDGLVLVFYNGSNNLSYAAYDLDGQTTDANGYFVIGNVAVPNVSSITFNSNGLQNGADAVALYSGDATDFPNSSAVTTTDLIDAFVYDTSDADDAELLVLLNPGEAQINEADGGDKDGQSSQRLPNGQGGARNTSSYSQLAPTPGAPNGAVVVPATILINEVDADTPGTDVQEFVELYDGGVGNSPLDGYVLVFYNGSNNLSYAAYDLDGQTTDANGYFVIGNAGVPNVSSITFNSNGLQNGADAVALYNADATDFPNSTAISTTNLVDAFVYDTSDADDAELLVLLNAGQAQINEADGGDKDNHSSQRLPNGDGGLRNTSTYGQAPPTPGAANAGIVVPATILINEVDADTPGSDTLEFVELYDGGVGNTPLDGYVLVMYNGSNNLSYGAYDLDGQTTNADGYFVLGNTAVANASMTLPSNGLQNGADAVALYNGDATDFPNSSVISTTNLVDAFVYDTNDSDDADLLVLLNAGQAQINEDGGGDKDNQSSQRLPNGDGGARNTSTYGQAPPTPGAVNAGIVVAPEVIINELDADTAGTDTLEFVELYDGGTGNTSLDGLVLVFYNGSNNLSYAAYDLDGQTTDANGYFVIGNVAVPNVSSITFGSNGLQNGADGVALYLGDATDFPSNSAVSTTNLLDALVYDTNDSDDAELAVLLNAGQAQINEDAAGNKDGHSLQRFANGTGGARNTSTYVQAIPTPGAANTNATEPINLVINELDADTAGSDTLEFIELYDGGTGNTSLDGFVIVMYNGSNNLSYAAYDLDGQTTNADGYFVLGNTAVPNVSMILPSNGLQNGADAVGLYTGDATDFPSSTAITTSNLIDALVYDTNDSDDAELLVLLNAGQAQVNEDGGGNKDGHSSQRIPNGQGGARNTSTYTQATPTPGTENGAIIPAPDAIDIIDARNATAGDLVTVSGVLTVSDQFRGSAYLQDATGGIAIFDSQVHGDGVFMIGDSITVTGTRSAFNDQVQLSTITEVTNNGLPNVPITPLTITLSQLGDHPAELVRIVNPSFPTPGDILFGNSNYTLTDGSGTGELRIDNDVTDLVGLGQPDTCSEAIGVVGRFFTTYQLLPRLQQDLACAPEYTAPDNAVEVDKAKALDIVTWNIEWFGDEANSPAAGNANSDQIQKDSVKTVIQRLNADIYAVQEIADDALFMQLVDELPGYDYVLSPATSRPNDLGTKQKIGFIYNTTTVDVLETKVLLESIHPLYNGGDDSALVGYPEADRSRFYASGRLPFMMKANITIDGTTQQINIVDLHARANSSSDPQGRYDMRKFDVEVLKDSLDAQYANSNLILLGDFNDDVDVTVADVVTTVSTYEAYVNDPVNYNIASATLSAQGFRSFAFRENMIDHITFSNELEEKYVDASVRVHYEFYDSDFTTTSSDHFPVSAQFLLKSITLDAIDITDVTCSGAADGSATVTVSGGCAPYSYEWSTGATTTENVLSGLEGGDYSVTIVDALNNSVVQNFTIGEGTPLEVTVTESPTVYLGYPPASNASIGVESVLGGEAPYTYEWNTGETTQVINVSPTDTTTYSVTITDAKGCSTTADVLVNVVDVTCGNYGHYNKVKMCYKGRKTICVPWWAAKWYLWFGYTLGECDIDPNEVQITNLRVYPNPFRNYLQVKIKSTGDANVDLIIYNQRGTEVFQTTLAVSEGRTNTQLNLSHLKRGFYYLRAVINGKVQKTRYLVKR